MKRTVSIALLVILVVTAAAMWMRACNGPDPYDPFTRELPVRVYLLCGECNEEVTYSPEDLQAIFREGRYVSDHNTGGGLLPCPLCNKMAVRQLSGPRAEP